MTVYVVGLAGDKIENYLEGDLYYTKKEAQDSLEAWQKFLEPKLSIMKLTIKKERVK